MKDQARQYTSSRRVRDQATIVLLLGLVLLVSPMAEIFNLDTRVLGIPFTLVYLFAVWAALIVATFRLARSLSSGEDGNGDDTAAAPEREANKKNGK